MDIHEQQQEASWVTRRWRFRKICNETDIEAQQRVDATYIPQAREHFKSLRAGFFGQIERLKMAIAFIDEHDFPRLDREEAEIRKPFEARKAEAHKQYRIGEISPALMGYAEPTETLEERERKELARLVAKYGCPQPE